MNVFNTINSNFSETNNNNNKLKARIKVPEEAPRQKTRLSPEEIRDKVNNHFKSKNIGASTNLSDINSLETESSASAEEKAEKMATYNSKLKDVLKSGSFNFSQKEREVLSKILV